MEIKIRESVIKKKRFDFFPLVLGIKSALINLKKSFWCKLDWFKQKCYI